MHLNGSLPIFFNSFYIWILSFSSKKIMPAGSAFIGHDPSNPALNWANAEGYWEFLGTYQMHSGLPSEKVLLNEPGLTSQYSLLVFLISMLLTLRGENPSFWPSSLRACDQHAFFNILSDHHNHHDHHRHDHHHQHHHHHHHNHYRHHRHDHHHPHHQQDHRHHHHHHLQLSQGLPCVSRQVQTQAVCENPFLVTLALSLSLSFLLLDGWFTIDDYNSNFTVGS